MTDRRRPTAGAVVALADLIVLVVGVALLIWSLT